MRSFAAWGAGKSSGRWREDGDGDGDAAQHGSTQGHSLGTGMSWCPVLGQGKQWPGTPRPAFSNTACLLFLLSGHFFSTPIIPASHWVDLTFEVLRGSEPQGYSLVADDSDYSLAVAMQWWCPWDTFDLPGASLLLTERQDELQEWQKPGHDLEVATESSGWSAMCLTQGSFQCMAEDWCDQEQVAALPCCIMGYTGACWSSGAACSALWDKEPMASHLNSVFGAPQAILDKPSVSQLPLAFWLCSSGMTHRYFFSYNLVSRGGKRGCLDWQGTAVHPCRDPPVLSWA